MTSNPFNQAYGFIGMPISWYAEQYEQYKAVEARAARDVRGVFSEGNVSPPQSIKERT